jgi:hypothetical protein
MDLDLRWNSRQRERILGGARRMAVHGFALRLACLRPDTLLLTSG